MPRDRGSLSKGGSVDCFASVKMDISSGGDGRLCDSTHISCLFPELLGLIFSYLDVQGRGRAAQVCMTWRDAAYHKSVWRGVEARLHLRKPYAELFKSLTKRGIRRIQILSLRRSLRDIFTGVKDLQSLNLSGCYNITDESLKQAFLQAVPTLTYLDLSLCKQISDNAVNTLTSSATNLEVLLLGGCSNVGNTSLSCIAEKLKKLRHLDLRSCGQIGNTGIGHLAGRNAGNTNDGTPQLEYLGLQDCQKLSDLALQYISSGLQNLKGINLSFCANINDSGMRHLSRMPSLREVNLRSCVSVTDIGIGYLSEGGSQITHLDVSFCDKISDSALGRIAQGLFTLRSLSMASCRITDEGLNRIARSLHQLHTLNIGQCSFVTDKGLKIISEHMTNLHTIDLYGCFNVSTVGLQRIYSLPRLKEANFKLLKKNIVR